MNAIFFKRLRCQSATGLASKNLRLFYKKGVIWSRCAKRFASSTRSCRGNFCALTVYKFDPSLIAVHGVRS